MSNITQWIVILVDDEPDSLNLVHDMLTLNGAQVHRASSGIQGLALLDTTKPTLIVVDLSMPKPDGWDLLGVIRAHPTLAQVPVVAITAYASDRVIEQARIAGFNALLPKPLKVGKLLSKLNEVVS